MGVRRALGVSAASQLVVFIATFASTVIVARILTPAEIGVFSVAVAALGIAHIFRDLGVSQFLVQAKEVDEQTFRAAFSVTLLSSWCIAGLLLLLKDVAAAFYRHDGIADVLALVSLNFVVLPFGSPHLAQLRREMKFDALATIKALNAIVSATVTVAAAYFGYSYLSMAIGAIAGHLCNVAAVRYVHPGRIFLLPTFKGLGAVVRFGYYSTITSVAAEIGNSAPDLILGRTLGFSSVAFFNRATGLRKMLMSQLLSLVQGVYFPSFSQQIRNGRNPAEIYCRSMVYLIAITAPAQSLLSLEAGPIIEFLFGPQWLESAALATILCAAAVLTTPFTMVNWSLIGCGRIELLLPVTVLVQGLRIAILATSIWLDLATVVMLFGLSFVVEALLLATALKRGLGLGIGALLRGTWKAYALVPATLIGPVALRWLPWSSALPSPWPLFLSLFMAGAGWLAGVALLRHPFRAEFALTLDKLRRIAQARRT